MTRSCSTAVAARSAATVVLAGVAAASAGDPKIEDLISQIGEPVVVQTDGVSAPIDPAAEGENAVAAGYEAWPVREVTIRGQRHRFLVADPLATVTDAVRVVAVNYPHEVIGHEPGWTLRSDLIADFEPPFSVTNPPAWAAEFGAEVMAFNQTRRSDCTGLQPRSFARLHFPTVDGMLDAYQQLTKDDPSIRWIEPHFGGGSTPFVLPRDPFITLQTYIGRRDYRPGVWMESQDFFGAWMLPSPTGEPETYGRDVTVAVCEPGGPFLHMHPELSPNYVEGSPIPAALRNEFQDHATSVAGIIGAAANRSDMVGCAPECSISSETFLDAAELARNYSWDPDATEIFNNSWGSAVIVPLEAPDGRDEDGDGRVDIINVEFPLFREWDYGHRDAFRDYVENGRCGLGGIVVQAAGNSGFLGLQYPRFHSSIDSTDAQVTAQARDRRSIVVGGALRNESEILPIKGAYYTSQSSCILVSGNTAEQHVFPTSTFRDITTLVFSRTQQGEVIRDGNGIPLVGSGYFGGTSAAAPMVSATIALMLEMNPLLTWRDVQHILVATADRSDGFLPEKINGAGLPWSSIMGFGRTNAYRAVAMSKHFPGVGPEKHKRVYLQHPVQTVTPDGKMDVLDSSVTIPAGRAFEFEARSSGVSPDDPTYVDHVVVYLRFLGDSGANTTVWVRSPSGTVSRVYGGRGVITDLDGNRGFVLNMMRDLNVGVSEQYLEGIRSVEFWNEPVVGPNGERWAVIVGQSGPDPGPVLSAVGLHLYGGDSIAEEPCNSDIVDGNGDPFPDGNVTVQDLEAWLQAMADETRSADISAHFEPFATRDGLLDEWDYDFYFHALQMLRKTFGVPCRPWIR